MNAEIKERIETIRRGQVPEGYSARFCMSPIQWEQYPLSKICKKRTLKNKDKSVDVVLSNSAAHGVVFQRDYFDKDIANEENTDGYFIVESGDFIYNPRISATAPYGPINSNRTGASGIVSPLYTVFWHTDQKKVLYPYLEYFFSSAQWHNYVYSVSNQGIRFDRMSITDEDFFAMPIPVPSIAEQQKIAEILTHCDKVIDLKKQFIEEKRRQKKWLVQNLLNPDSGVRLPGFEGSKWNSRTLKQMSSLIADGDWIESKDQSASGIRLIQTGNVDVGKFTDKSERARYIDEATFSRLNCTEVFAGDILISRLPDPIGRACIIPDIISRAITAVDCTIVRFKKKSEAILFVQHSCTEKYFKDIFVLSGGSTRTRISRKELERLSVPMPQTEAEQTAIADVLSTANLEIDLLEQGLAQWQTQKRSLMQLLLKGIVRVEG